MVYLIGFVVLFQLFLIFSFIIIFDDIVFKNLILNYVPSNVLDKENFSKLIIYPN